MAEATIEPRTPIWARAEVSWYDQAGLLCVAPATLEDTSRSGACVRLDRLIDLGSLVTVKWHRGEFSAVAKNCRSDGRDFLLGLRRVSTQEQAEAEVAATGANGRQAADGTTVTSRITQAYIDTMQLPPAFRFQTDSKLASLEPVASPIRVAALEIARRILSRRPAANADSASSAQPDQSKVAQPSSDSPQGEFRSDPARADQVQTDPARSSEVSSPSPQSPLPGHQRSVMESKSQLSKFWRRQEIPDTADKVVPQPSAGDNPLPRTAEVLPGPKGDLLAYEDIYRAAGILSARSAYDIGKVVEMLHCDRMRGLADDVRRMSVLMAIEAAGACGDDLLRDATERQKALDAYEDSQRRHLEEFEAQKAQDNAKIETEMARVSAHYAERIKANLDQVAREKEALRNWQMAKQGETQRISEVIELCTKPPVSEPRGAAVSAAAGARPAAGPANAGGPSLVPEAMSARPN